MTSMAATDEYWEFCSGIRALSGIDLSQYKRSQMERRIRSHARRQGSSGLSAYLTTLRGSREELDTFLDRVTINVSQLWRNPDQWTTIAREILPSLAERGSINAWSAGSSYGAEAYTLAALSREVGPRARVRILGTDIDPRMVERAREGWFTEEDARDAPPELLARWFEPQPDGNFRALPRLRAVTKFEVGDLLRLDAPAERYDLVLCRNTVIYFTEPVRDALHERLAASLKPGGWLVVGNSERVATPGNLGLAAAHPFIYRKS